jgi:hypothetical protein
VAPARQHIGLAEGDRDHEPGSARHIVSGQQPLLVRPRGKQRAGCSTGTNRGEDRIVGHARTDRIGLRRLLEHRHAGRVQDADEPARTDIDRFVKRPQLVGHQGRDDQPGEFAIGAFEPAPQRNHDGAGALAHERRIGDRCVGAALPQRLEEELIGARLPDKGRQGRVAHNALRIDD